MIGGDRSTHRERSLRVTSQVAQQTERIYLFYRLHVIGVALILLRLELCATHTCCAVCCRCDRRQRKV
eukprot:3582935-Amphidinium_carterae.1